MKTIDMFILLPFASYGLAIAVQMARKNYFNWKPLNCKMCISFWSSFAMYSWINQVNEYNGIIYGFIYGLFVLCLANFLKLLEDKIIGDRGIL